MIFVATILDTLRLLSCRILVPDTRRHQCNNTTRGIIHDDRLPFASFFYHVMI